MSLFAPRTQFAVLRVEHLEDRSVPAALDLTSAGSAGEFNGAVFAQSDARSRGVDTFLRLNAWHSTTQGYNTAAPKKQFDASPWQTHALKVSDLPAVTVNGVKYRELVLSVQQPKNSPNVSLDELKLFVSDNAKLTGYKAASGTLGGLAPVYNLDAGGDNWVKLNARLSGGSGRADALVYVPDAALSGGKYLFLYSKFGVNSSAQCGQVDWGYGRCGPLGQPPAPPTQPTATVSGVVFQDYNGDGIRDEGEPGVEGKVVWADANNNGVLDAGEASTTTAADGSYTLAGLTPGVELVIRSINDDGYPTSGVLVTLSPGETLYGVDIGLNISSPS